jgi:saccharopine dehydrogenase-like NADP-dependent oxidoreductase
LNAEKENWQLTVVDGDLQLARSKIGNSSYGLPLSFDIKNDMERKRNIEESNLVISLLPPALHYIVAQDCVELKKDLLTASYVDDQIRDLNRRSKTMLALCRNGFDRY